jgi:hypothetical protein
MPPSVDDGSILQEAGLLRRLHPKQVIPDKNTGKTRPSSAGFKDLNLSVDAEPILRAAGLDWRFTLQGHPGCSLVRFPAGSARERGLSVVPKPTPENPAHTEVIGKKTQSIAKHLSDVSEWVHLEIEHN